MESVIIEISGTEYENVINSEDMTQFKQFMLNHTYPIIDLITLSTSPKNVELLNDPELCLIGLMCDDNGENDSILCMGLVSEGLSYGDLVMNGNKILFKSEM